MSASARSARRRGRSDRHKRQPPADCPMLSGFAVAEGLAARAVTTWVVTAGGSDARVDHIELVRQAVSKAAGQPDAIAELHRLIDEHITDRTSNIQCADAATSLLVAAAEAGYLYGLALGIALTKGGAR
jgi:hypothetical protein